jgi:hypothetical protein
VNSWLAAAPKSSVAHGEMGCAVSVKDLADPMPRPLTDGQVLDLAGDESGGSRRPMSRTGGTPG